MVRPPVAGFSTKPIEEDRQEPYDVLHHALIAEAVGSLEATRGLDVPPDDAADDAQMDQARADRQVG